MELRIRLLQREIQHMGCYPKFLTDVCNVSDEFHDAETVRQRFENLNTTKE